jgi:hypothetical protein
MAGNDIDRDEIDRLIKDLAAARRQAPAPVATSTPSATTPAVPTPGRRWTTARLLMPAARTERRNWLAGLSAIELPAWAKLPAWATSGFPRLTDAQWNTWSARVFVGLGVLLSAAMPYWPYANAWSWGLLAYLCVVELIVVTGIWGAKLTWDARLPAAHTVAVGTVCWGLALLASETVPRIAYAASRAV